MPSRPLISEEAFKYYPEKKWPDPPDGVTHSCFILKPALLKRINEFLDTIPDDAYIEVAAGAITASWSRLAVEVDMIPDEDDESEE